MENFVQGLAAHLLAYDGDHVASTGAASAGAARDSAYEAAKMPVQMIAFGAIILAAYLGGRITRHLRLSEVTGQMLGGMAVGPFVLHSVGALAKDQRLYDDALHAFYFFVFVYLCLIAFGIGEELHISRIKKVGLKATIIAALHCLLTFALVTGGLHGLGGMSLLNSMVIASIGITSAPTIAFVLMNQMRVEGYLRQMAAGVLVITDLIGIVLFSLLLQIALVQKNARARMADLEDAAEAAARAGEASSGAVLLTVGKEILLASLLGVVVFVALRFLIRREAAVYDELPERPPPSQRPASLMGRSRDSQVIRRAPFLRRLLAANPSPSVELMLMTMGAVSLGAGIAYFFHLPFLLTAVLAGFLVANYHSFAIFDSLKIESITAAFNLAFFGIVGAKMSISYKQPEVLWLAGIYIVARTVGKYGGMWLACRWTREDRKTRIALPAQMLPQTGVAAVEAVYVALVLQDNTLKGVILPAIVVFGVAGVVAVERSLSAFLAIEKEEDLQAKTLPAASSATAEAARRLLAYLSPERVMVDLQGANKMAVIEEMLNRARETSHHHIDRGQALQTLHEREQLAPTGLGHGIALPHCRLIGLEEPLLILGKHSEGVVFGGIDDEPCDLILMIFSSGRNPAEHLQLMAAAAHVLGNSLTRQNLRRCTDAETIMQIIILLAEHTEDE